MTTRIELGNLTIHRIVEQEGPFFDVLKFFPTLTKELLEENRAWLQPRFLDPGDQLMLCIQSYLVQHAAPQHPGRHLRRQPQAATDAAVLAHDEVRSLREEPGRHGLGRRRHRFRHVHASAHRPCRLEHAARQRPLGADLPQGALRLRRSRARLLDQAPEGRCDGCPLGHRLGAADRRRQPRRHRQERARLQRSRHADPHARPQHRPLLACRSASRAPMPSSPAT